MSDKSSLAVAYAVKRKPKKMAEGGKVDKLHQGAKEARKYSSQKEEKGVNTPRMPYPHSKESMGESDAGYSAKDKSPELNEQAKNQHKKTLEEMKKMPKPKLQGLAEGGMVKSSIIKTNKLDALGRKLDKQESHLIDSMPPKDETEHIAYDDTHATESKQFADGGIIDTIKDAFSEDAPKPKKKMVTDQQASDMKKVFGDTSDRYAEGGSVEDESEIEHAASIASAVMAKMDEQKYAMGGQVDIESNGAEQPESFTSRNEAALKENYDSDMEDVSQPMDSNEMGDSREASESDPHDRVSRIMAKMSKRSPITR